MNSLLLSLILIISILLNTISFRPSKFVKLLSFQNKVLTIKCSETFSPLNPRSQGVQLFVGNLPFDIDDLKLRDLFSNVKDTQLLSAKVIYSKDTGKYYVFKCWFSFSLSLIVDVKANLADLDI